MADNLGFDDYMEGCSNISNVLHKVDRVMTLVELTPMPIYGMDGRRAFTIEMGFQNVLPENSIIDIRPQKHVDNKFQIEFTGEVKGLRDTITIHAGKIGKYGMFAPNLIKYECWNIDFGKMPDGIIREFQMEVEPSEILVPNIIPEEYIDEFGYFSERINSKDIKQVAIHRNNDKKGRISREKHNKIVKIFKGEEIFTRDRDRYRQGPQLMNVCQQIVAGRGIENISLYKI